MCSLGGSIYTELHKDQKEGASRICMIRPMEWECGNGR